MTILIDNMTGSVNLVNYPPLNDPSIAMLCHLDSGDALFTGNGPDGEVSVAVEVKHITDLVSSSDTKRLNATQIPRMLEAYDVNYLLYYGLYRPNPNDGTLQLWHGSTTNGKWVNHKLGTRSVPYGYVESSLLSIEAAGIRVHYVGGNALVDKGMSHAAEWLGCCYRWWQKQWTDHKYFHVFHSRPIPNPKGERSVVPVLDDITLTCAEFASKLPGLGYTRAVAAARYFNSDPWRMLTATVDDWAQVPGVGKVIASAIHRFIRLPKGYTGVVVCK